jgi:hypothetical protein
MTDIIEFKDLESEDEDIKKELELLQALNPIYLRTEELPEDFIFENPDSHASH